jgi:hypothetical protein
MVRLLSPVSACTLLISVLLSSVMSDILIIRKNHICQALYIDQRVYVKLSLNNERLKHGSFNITAKEAILLAILLHGKEGISGKDLEYQSGVSRQTINQERVVLKRNGLIQYKTSGKRTTYFPTKKVLEDRYFRSWIYGKELFNKLESRSVFLDSPFYDTNFSLDNKTEKLLFEFSLRLGSILTYMFLQVMNPAFIKDLTFNQEISSKEIKDYLIKDWIKNIINPIRALTKIRQSLYLLGYKFEVRTSKEPKNYSFYELETKSFEKLLEAFARLYPYIYKELGKVSDDLSKTTESWKKSMERAGCKHGYSIFRNKRPKASR